ncbi:recombination regulator RecX [Candidatus Enterococcus willemsii]|uniref:Regulatory protein RecX n=1 Tax=Candidatus Enterococcus willemsii TaxID=1857215 RepID=A0ABQ6Z1Y0_9ENTE|nr:recombination regulator RecX [Enterococcus sp. CU12B]KAF1305411.1 recombination regulator RecX [Enterococcus sp. CU12B]
MLKVTSISKDKSNFYKVRFDDKRELRISEDLLVRYRLLKGTEITEQVFEEIKKSAGYDIGLQLAMNYISYQLRTEQEMRIYLKDKEINREDTQKIIQRLQELQLVDDVVYGQSFVRTQMRLSDKGPQAISQQLRKKGLKNDVIEEVMYLYTPEDQFDIAFKTATKSLQMFHGKSHRETLQKLRIKLMQKGFSSDIISLVMAELPDEKDEEAEWDAIQKEGAKLLRRHPNDQQKLKQKLYQKGFEFDLIQRFIDEEIIDEE